MSEDEKPELSFDDRMRAGIYGLLGVVLTESPDPEQLIQIAAMRENESDLGQAMGALSQMAQMSDPVSVAAEFKTLFGPMLKPLASKQADDPDSVVAAIKAENERLSITPFEGEDEAEDHIAALCDTMASLILSQHNTPLTPEDNKAFFNAAIAPWAGSFFEKLEGKRTAKFYGPVGTLGKVFMESEAALCSAEAD